MKKLWLTVVIFLLTCVQISSPVQAGMQEELSQKLELSEQQLQDVKRILGTEASKLMELAQSNLSDSEKNQRFRTIQQQALDNLAEVLTIEQQQKFVQFQSKYKEKLRAKKTGNQKTAE